MSNKLTTTQFIEKAISIHGDKYDYSKVDYENAHSKVVILCGFHGDFYQTPNSHLGGSGCKKCGVDKRSKLKSSDTETFILRSKSIFGDKFDYSKTVYVKSRLNLTITCKRHGDFEQRPYVHFKSASGCPGCYKEKSVSDSYVYLKEQLDLKFRNLIQPEEYKLIPLGNNKFAMVDNEDFDLVKDINWHADKLNYAKTGFLKRRGQNCALHRFLMNAKKNQKIDHKDGNPLNNRRSNLRFCTSSENSCNSRKRKNTTSIYKGVSLDKKTGMWNCAISKSRKTYTLGLFSSEKEAAEAYNEKALELHGEFAKLNIIE